MKESVLKYLCPIRKGYEVFKKPPDYFSVRYQKKITHSVGDTTDGATFFPDIDSWFWLRHDQLRDKQDFHRWADGTHCSNWKASVVCYDILMSENRRILAPMVFLGTLLFGYTKQLFKGLR